MDDDLQTLDRETLIAEVKKLRAGIRAHRDTSGHDLCWHHPDLWDLLPEKTEPSIAVPPWPQQSCRGLKSLQSGSTARRARRSTTQELGG